MKKYIIVAIMILLAITTMLPALIVIPFSETASDRALMVPIDSEVSVEDLTESKEVSIRVMRSTTNEVEEVDLETYVAHVVAAEMPASFEEEALKAQALAARTYMVQRLANEAGESEYDVTDTVEHQVYLDEEQLRERFGLEFSSQYSKIEEAVKTTEGEIITFDGSPITAAFFSTSNGHTENAHDYWQNEIPYLMSVESPWDEASPVYSDQEIYTLSEISQKLGLENNALFNVSEISRTSSNRIKEMKINGQTFTGREIREKLNLRSNDFDVEPKGDHVVFTTTGYGHGVGMSQYGANGMASHGYDYRDIVQHYYQNVTIQTIDEIEGI
ncbi:stage II sporulation protein D [Halalkalibacillus halophilus]|uniref:stage II sporulation protein D n=1 Tax=Halalkalibacillus halophilus TaxID=392827 RepID=UPI000413DCEF|nr:stage II sporulation protein D [Halalkalibacillus halophilus]